MWIVMMYLMIVNLFAFVLFGVDKQRARQNRWRIPEATLLGAALFGGSVGAYAGMKIFHHKTRKPKFSVGVPMTLIAELAVMWWILQ